MVVGLKNDCIGIVSAHQLTIDRFKLNRLIKGHGKPLG